MGHLTNKIADIAILILIGLLILFASSGHAQEQKLEIRDFAGLNTRSSDFNIKPNEARIAHNIDFSRGGVGSIAKRLGYDSISVMVGQDSLLGIYGAYYRDGRQQLIVVADSAGVGYGGIYATPMGSVNIYDSATLITSLWGTQTSPSFTMFRDQVYIVNGAQRGMLWNGEVARKFPLAAPGEPTIIPITMDGSSDEDYYLSGEFRYIFEQVIYGAARVWYNVHVDSLFDSYTYFDTVISGACATCTTVVGYESSADASRYEVGWGLVDTINSHSTLNTVIKAFKVRTPSGGRYHIKEIHDTADVAFIPDTTQTITDTVGSNANDSVWVLRSVISSPVIVDSGRVLITDFPTVTGDTTGGLSIDSIRVHIFRSQPNPGSLDYSDVADSVGSFLVASASVDTLSDFIWIDSLPDSAVSASGLLIDQDMKGRDSTGAYSRRLGAPGLLYTDAGGTGTAPPGRGADDSLGIYFGWPAKQKDTLGVLYACTFIDTVTGIESDTGRSLFLSYRTPTGYSRGYGLSLPQIPTDDSGMVICLYRAAVAQITKDSTFYWIDSIGYTIYEVSDKYQPSSEGWESYTGGMFGRDKLWRRPKSTNYTYHNKSATYLAVDSIAVGSFFLVDILPSTTEAYFDDMMYDTLTGSAPTYTRHAPPSNLKQLFPMDNRLFGTKRSSLSFSYLDSGTYWSAFANIPVDPDDGDEITAAYQSRGVVKLKKNKSGFNVYQDANLNWERTEISGLYGCIAPRSHAKGFGGHYFLSDIGVIQENEGQYLERTQQARLVSTKLNNFDALSLATKQKAKGFYHNQKYMLSIGSTTYVYDERADAWATWGLTFLDATLYGVESDVTFYPGDTMYFIMAGDSLLYRYGASEKDKGGDYPKPQYKTGPLFLNDSWQTVTRIGLWTNSSDESANILRAYLRNEDEVSLTYVSYSDLSSSRLHNKSFPDNIALGHRLYIIGFLTGFNSTVIDGIDLWYINQGFYEIE